MNKLYFYFYLSLLITTSIACDGITFYKDCAKGGARFKSYVNQTTFKWYDKSYIRIKVPKSCFLITYSKADYTGTGDVHYVTNECYKKRIGSYKIYDLSKNLG